MAKKKGRNACDDIRDEIQRQRILGLTATSPEQKAQAEKEERGLKCFLAFLERRRRGDETKYERATEE